MKFYKNLYLQAAEEAYYWKNCYYELQRFDKLKQKEKAVSPYCVGIFLKNGESEYIVNVIKHEVNHTNCHPFYNPENWKITTADGLVSVFKYDEVKYILAYRKVEE